MTATFTIPRSDLPTVAFVSPKGGAGKTTAALLLALGLNARGKRVAIVDSDPNKPMLDWYRLPGCPDGISVHVAPFERDLPDALREASGKRPDFIVLDTEGSPRPGLAFAAAKPDLVITPLASSALEANQAVKAAEMVRNAALKLRRPVLHRCLLTRLPAAFRPRSLRSVVETLRSNGIEILSTPLIEKEAFRSLFFVGGGLAGLEAKGAPGLEAARINAEAYVQEVSDLLDVATGTVRTGT